MIAGVGHGPLHRLLGRVVVPLALFLLVLPRLRYDPVRLMAILRGQFMMPPQNFFRRQQFLAIACVVSGDLSRCRSVDALLPQMIFDLFPARAGGLQILLRVAPDFRLSMLAAL